MVTYNGNMLKKVLIVDDDKDILEGIAIVLEIEGYSVETITKGEETYKKVDEFKPDIILLDIRMSGSDGRAICRRLKAEGRWKSIPIIMVSADQSAKGSSLAYGADDFLAKPFDTQDLVAVIKKFTVD